MKRTIVSKKEHKVKSKLFESKAYDTILAFLMKYPNDSFSLSELAKKAGVPKSNVGRVLEMLKEEELIVVGEIANLFRIQFNSSNLRAIGFKIGVNLIYLYRSGIIEYILKMFSHPRSIVLFGSMRKGEDSPGSDIDIAIELEEDSELEIVSLDQFKKDKALKQLQEFEDVSERKFKLHFFGRKKIDPNLFANIVNGILLYGLLEAKP